jgi:hypothetical protein
VLARPLGHIATGHGAPLGEGALLSGHFVHEIPALKRGKYLNVHKGARASHRKVAEAPESRP